MSDPTSHHRFPAGDVVVLPDGGRVLVRPLTSADRDGYLESMEAMSPRSRYLRFASPKPRLTEAELDYLTRTDGDHHVALVAVAGTPARGVAVARYITGEDGSAEVAVGVVDAWQGRGLGALLVERLVRHAREHGLRTLEATTLSENEASAALLRRLGFRPAGLDGIYRSYRLGLAA